MPKKSLVRLIFIHILVSAALSVILVNFSEKASERLAVRFLHFARFGSLRPHKISEGGVPMLRYARVDRNYHWNPVYVAVYGLSYYDQWLDNGEFRYFTEYYDLYPPKVRYRAEWFSYVLSVADWLCENIKTSRFGGIEYGTYEYDFAWPIYHLKAPWRSAMAQGLAIQLLARVWSATGERKYLDTACLARNAFFIEVKDGGVTYKDSSEDWWYEEYAGSEAKQSRVLNGMLHALIALREFNDMIGDNESGLLFKKGLNSLAKNIRTYDAPRLRGSYYDALGLPANWKYHNINTNLARKLDSLISTNAALDIWEKWETSKLPFIFREILKAKPTVTAITTLALNWLAIFTLTLILWRIVVLIIRGVHAPR